MLSSQPILEVTDLVVHRGDTRILDRVTWTVHPGEHWVILGSNGSGKTSLLSALTGYLSPTDGEISVLGERFGASDWRELRTSIGIVSSSVRQLMHEEEPALTTIVSGKYAMIDYWGSVKKKDRLEALQILQQIEGAHLADRPWLVLSQGERQRVLIGRALMAKPKLLILDEPCAGLDPVAREHFLDFLQRLGAQRDAPALLLVTHHVEEIVPVFSHALLLREGRVLVAAKKERALTSANLTNVFGARCRLAKRAMRYALRIDSPSCSVL
jgi:iron complex transport system ATP-binding protein